jgi:hypothetical protein
MITIYYDELPCDPYKVEIKKADFDIAQHKEIGDIQLAEHRQIADRAGYSRGFDAGWKTDLTFTDWLSATGLGNNPPQWLDFHKNDVRI